MAEITKIRDCIPHKNKENKPPAPPIGGKKRGGGGEEMDIATLRGRFFLSFDFLLSTFY